MTRKYKTNYKTHRNVSRFAVTFDAPTLAATVEEKCTICGGEIEESPMLRGVCYGCYRNIVTGENKPDPRLTRRDAILIAFRDEPLNKSETSELYSELEEIDQALQFHPSDTCNDFIGARFERMDEIPF
jgi:hypothetical protein